MYQIQYTYDTGDSLNCYNDQEDILDVEWSNLDVAKANLKRIKEHYEQYRACESFFDKRSKQEIFETNLNKDWFVKEDRLVAFDKNRPQTRWAIDEKHKSDIEGKGFGTMIIIDEMTAQYNIRLFTDDGKPWQLFAPWCGHFETLKGAKIVFKSLEGSDMEFEF